MAIRYIGCPDSVPTESRVHNGGAVIADLEGMAPFQAYFLNTSVRGNYSRDAEGYLLMNTGASGSSSVSKNCHISAQLRDLIPGFNAQSIAIFGFRFKSTLADVTSAMAFTGAISNVGETAVAETLDAILLSEWAWVAGEDVYLEVELNLPAGMIYRRVDGVALTPIAIPAWVLTAAAASDASALRVSIGTSQRRQWLSSRIMDMRVRDIVVMERTSDGINSSFLGPQVVKRCPIASAVSSDWTASSGTPQAALATPITTVASRVAPYAESKAPDKALPVQFDTSGLNTDRIRGAAFTAAAKRQTGTGAKLSMSVKDGDVSSNEVVKSLLTTDFTFGLNALTLNRDFEGKPLTKAKLAALTFNIKTVSGV